MAELDLLIRQLEKSGQDIFWQGEATQASVDGLEALLGVRLPISFRHFLCTYGGGGVVGEEISGIEDNDPTLEHRGTVLGDTLHCRSTYELPRNLLMVYFGDHDVVWCLDVGDFRGDECPMVSFDVYSKTVLPLAPNFESFFKEYLELRISK